MHKITTAPEKIMEKLVSLIGEKVRIINDPEKCGLVIYRLSHPMPQDKTAEYYHEITFADAAVKYFLWQYFTYKNVGSNGYFACSGVGSYLVTSIKAVYESD